MSTTTIERRRSARLVDEPEIEIDPRIADRRSAVQREHRRKRLRTLVVLSIVTVIALAGVGLTRSVALDVDHIAVVGADRTAVEGMIGASGLSLGAPMTELDLAGARQAIAELPWVDDVRVKRQWPNRISIAVRERVPVAAVPATDGRWALVDEGGHVLTVSDAVSERWVHIEGLEPASGPGATLDDSAADALVVAADLPPDLRAGLERIEVDQDREFWLHFGTGPRVRLGGVDHLDDKLAAVLSVFDQVDPCGIDVIDVRAVDLISVTRVPSCQAGATAEGDAGPAGADDAAAGAADDPTSTAGEVEVPTGAVVEPAPVDQPVVEGDVDG